MFNVEQASMGASERQHLSARIAWGLGCRMQYVWVVGVEGDDGELRPWHYIHVHWKEGLVPWRAGESEWRACSHGAAMSI